MNAVEAPSNHGEIGLVQNAEAQVALRNRLRQAELDPEVNFAATVAKRLLLAGHLPGDEGMPGMFLAAIHLRRFVGRDHFAGRAVHAHAAVVNPDAALAEPANLTHLMA